MHTMTTVRGGACSTGRMTRRSMRRPPTKAMTRVAEKAVQYERPALSIDQAR